MTPPVLPSPLAQTLSERLASQLRQKIAEGELSPGQRLSEQALSDELGVSRNTLREVFRLLTKDGLVKHLPNRGVFVAVPGIASIIDIYRVRRVVECHAMSHAYPRHPATRKMRDSIAMALQHRSEGRWVAVGTANMAFHTGIVELADSERLSALFAPMLTELRLVFGLLRDAEFLHDPFVEMNLKILEQAEAFDFPGAAAALHDYLLHSERTVLAGYARQFPESS